MLFRSDFCPFFSLPFDISTSLLSKTTHQPDVDDEVDPLLCFDDNNDVEMSNGSEKKGQKSPVKSKPAIVSNDDDDDFEEEVKPPKRKQAPKKEPKPEKQPRKQKVN